MSRALTVVPAVPPQPPQLGLLVSAVRPVLTSDESGVWQQGDRQTAMLPAELRAELEMQRGDAWIRGFTWAPENTVPAVLRDACDEVTVDASALNAPTGLVTVPSAAGGSLATATYSYQVTAVNGNGETTALPAVTAAVVSAGSLGSVALTWQPTADGVRYRVYGRVAGSIGLLATVGPFTADNLPAYVDTGSPAPGAAVPGANTTGGAGSYGNLAIRTCIPPVLMVEDSCSSWGFDERDFKGRALRLLERAETQALEREFWTGALSTAAGYGNRFLADGNAGDLTPGGGPVSVARGFALLQDALASCGFGGQGMIHCQPQTTGNLLNVRRVGRLLLDIFDNIVVPGVGYPGTGDGGAAPAAGTAWMYASDLVSVRSEAEGTVYPGSFAEALDRGQGGQPNRITFRAEKVAVAYADFACQFKVRVTLPS